MSDTTFEREVERNFPWNFAVNLVDLAFIMMGLNLVSRETVIPLLVSNLTSSTVAIGLVIAVYSLGTYLPQLFAASYAESLSRKKPFVALFGGVGERVPYLMIGVAVWFLAENSPGAALVALVVFMGLSGLAVGIATPAWFDMIAKVIPLRRRGVFAGTSASVGAVMGVAGAAGLGLILEKWPYPQNFALLFILAFCSMAVSWVGLVLNREPDSPVVKERPPLSNYLRRLPSVLRNNRNFSTYLAASAVVRLGTMAGGFFLVYGTDRFALTGTDVGLLTAVLIGSQAVVNPLWGVLGDRWGHKVVLASGACALAAAALTVWLATSWFWLVVSFALLGAFLASDSASFLNIIPEFCAEGDRPTYIGLTNTLLAPVTTLAPLLGGWLAGTLGYRPMFACAALAAGIGAALLAVWVREPRRAIAKPILNP